MGFDRTAMSCGARCTTKRPLFDLIQIALENVQFDKLNLLSNHTPFQIGIVERLFGGDAAPADSAGIKRLEDCRRSMSEAGRLTKMRFIKNGG